MRIRLVESSKYQYYSDWLLKLVYMSVQCLCCTFPYVCRWTIFSIRLKVIALWFPVLVFMFEWKWKKPMFYEKSEWCKSVHVQVFDWVYLYGFMYSLSNVQCVFTSILSINGMVETSMFVHVLLCTFLKEEIHARDQKV